MANQAKDPIQELKTVLSEQWPWHGARISFLAQFLLALLKVRSVNLAALATGFGGKAAQSNAHHLSDRLWRYPHDGACDKGGGYRLSDQTGTGTGAHRTH
jgi:hypothetical protein